MADKELLEILRQGSDVWNRYRKDNPDLTPDFSGADLRDTDLFGVNLTQADLRGANLTRAILSQADLSRASLIGAHLRGADLSGANLSRALISGADLTYATVTGADFAGVEGLSTVKGLEGVKTISPELNVKQADVDPSQQIPLDDIRQQAQSESEIPDSGDIGKFTPETEGSDSEQEKGGWGEKWGDSWGGAPSPAEAATDGAPKVWLTSGMPSQNPDVDLLTKVPGSTTTWVVPKGTTSGDYILFWVAENNGLLYGCKVLSIDEERSRTEPQRKYAKLLIKVRFDTIIPFAKLKADEVLKEWPLVKGKMQGTVRNQTQDLKSQHEVWIALKNLIITENPSINYFFSEIEGEKVKVDPQESLIADRPATEDLLGHLRIVKVLSSFLSTRETEFPLSIAIDAPWGTGKSTLMYLLQNELQDKDDNILREVKEKYKGDDKYKNKYIEYLNDRERINAANDALSFTWHDLRKLLKEKKTPPEREKKKRDFETINFNAWRHGTGDRLSASMVSHVTNTVASRMDPIDREKFWFRLNMRRLDLNSLRSKAHWSILGGSIVGIISLVALIIILLSLPLLDNLLPQVMIDKILFLDAGGPIMALILLSYTIVTNLKKTVSFDMSEYVRSPNYQELMGPQQEIEKDFHHTINHLKRDGKSLAVFVDDLDRCSPNQVVEVVESINLFFGQQDCVFIIGMHRDLVATSLELAYDKLVAKVKAAPHLTEELPYGQRFLEKIVQFVVRLPEPNEDDLERFLDNIDGSSAKPGTNKIVKSIGDTVSISDEPDATVTKAPSKDDDIYTTVEVEAKKAVAVAKTYSERTVEVKEIFKLVKDALRRNPRQYVRFFNALRFDYYISAAEELEKPGIEDFLIMAKWVVISLEWPVLGNLISSKRKKFNEDLKTASGKGEAAAAIEELVKESIDVNSENDQILLEKMHEVIFDERMLALLNVKISG